MHGARWSSRSPTTSPASPDREGSVTDSKVWGKLLAYNLDYDRKAPLEFVRAVRVARTATSSTCRRRYTLDSPPRDQTVRCSKWGTFTLKVKPTRDGRRAPVEFEFTLRLDKARVEPADFDEFRTFHEDVNRHYRVWLTLKPAQDLADAAAAGGGAGAGAGGCGQRGGAGAAVSTQRQGRCGAGDAAPRLVYSPDDLDLWKHAVKLAKTPADEEEAQRELVRRFPDEPKYVIDLAAILIGRGKQEEARKLLEPLSRVGPLATRAQAHYQLARSYYRRDELKEALSQLDSAAKADAETVNTVRAQHAARPGSRRTERTGAGQAGVRASPAGGPRGDGSAGFAGTFVAGHGQEVGSADYLRRYVLAVGAEPAGTLIAAEWYRKLGDDAAALDLAGRVKDERFLGRAERTIGLVHLRRGELPEAAEHLARADAEQRRAGGTDRRPDRPGRPRRGRAGHGPTRESGWVERRPA